MLAAAVIFLGLFLYQNVVDNLSRQSIATGFGFLGQVSEFEIGESLIEYSSRSTYSSALLVGMLNTLVVSAAGIVLATIVGFLTNRGLSFALSVAHPTHSWMWIALLAAIILTFVANSWARRHRETTGKYIDMLFPGLALIIGLPVLAWLIGGTPHDISYPVRKGFNFVGGFTLSPEFAELMIGISIYASSFIAEIVRSGIQATAKG